MTSTVVILAPAVMVSRWAFTSQSCFTLPAKVKRIVLTLSQFSPPDALKTALASSSADDVWSARSSAPTTSAITIAKAASGVTILLVEQNINFAKRLGDTVAVMDNGVVVHAGSMKELAEDEELQHSLLGLAL